MAVKVKVSGVTPAVKINVGAGEVPKNVVPTEGFVFFITRESIIEALGYTPVGEITNEVVVKALGYTPIKGITKSNVVEALGFTPLKADSSEDIINVLGYTPADASLYVEDTTYPGCYYRMVDGEREWLNPPMVTGTEYRTTKRYNGRVVYTKVVDGGALPNTSSKAISFGVKLKDKVSAKVKIDNGTFTTYLPFVNENGGQARYFFANSSGDMSLKTHSNVSDYNAEITIEYTK